LRANLLESQVDDPAAIARWQHLQQFGVWANQPVHSVPLSWSPDYTKSGVPDEQTWGVPMLIIWILPVWWHPVKGSHCRCCLNWKRADLNDRRYGGGGVWTYALELAEAVPSVEVVIATIGHDAGTAVGRSASSPRDSRGCFQTGVDGRSWADLHPSGRVVITP